MKSKQSSSSGSPTTKHEWCWAPTSHGCSISKQLKFQHKVGNTKPLRVPDFNLRRPLKRTGTDDLEDLRGLRLDSAMQAELLEAQTECTVVFTNEDGWASGVVMTYLHLENCFWLTTVEGRAQVRGIAHDPRISLVFRSVE